MNAAKIADKLNGHSSIAQKVFGAVPANEAWEVYQIHAELRRQGSHVDRSVIEACLGQLTDNKLVKRVGQKPYSFIRVNERQAVKRKEEDSKVIPMKDETPKLQAVAPSDPLSKLANLASSLRNIANAIEETALEIEQARSAEADKLDKLHQLQALLKGL